MLAASQACRVTSADSRGMASGRDIAKKRMEVIRLPDGLAEKGFIFIEKFRGRFLIGTKRINQIIINSRRKK